MIRSTRPRYGFTLLETVLAIALSAALLLLISGALTIYSRLVSDRRAEVVNAQLARAAVDMIALDIRSAFISAEAGAAMAAGDTDEGGTDGGDTGGDLGGDTGDDTGTDTSDTSSVASADLAQGTVASSAGLYGNQYQIQIDVLGRFMKPVKYDQLLNVGAVPPLSDPQIVSYFLRPVIPAELVGTPFEVTDVTSSATRSVLIRREQGRATAVYEANYGASATPAREQMLSDQIVALEFAYFDGIEWLTEWDSDFEGGLPVAVQITIAVMDMEAAVAGSSVTSASTSSVAEYYQRTVYLPLSASAQATDGLSDDTSDLGGGA